MASWRLLSSRLASKHYRSRTYRLCGGEQTQYGALPTIASKLFCRFMLVDITILRRNNSRFIGVLDADGSSAALNFVRIGVVADEARTVAFINAAE